MSYKLGSLFMFNYYLGLGTNLGDKRANLLRAVDEIEQRIGRKVCLSRFYETEPWGYESTNTYLNAVVCIESSLPPMELLAQTQVIEQELGRMHKSVNGVYADRLIDIDILLMGDLVLQTEVLTIPHPLMHQRLFVMEPLIEIAPTVVHPQLKMTVCEIFNNLKR